MTIKKIINQVEQQLFRLDLGGPCFPKKFGLYEARAAICPNRQGMHVAITITVIHGQHIKKPRPDGQQFVQHPHKGCDHSPVNGGAPFDVSVAAETIISCVPANRQELVRTIGWYLKSLNEILIFSPPSSTCITCAEYHLLL